MEFIKINKHTKVTKILYRILVSNIEHSRLEKHKALVFGRKNITPQI